MAASTEPIEFVPGSTLISSFADPTRTYLSNRVIDNLVTLGAMNTLLASVARRVDGIIDNKPANGRFSVDELERFELPQYFATLFPNEQAEFPRLWSLLEAPPPPPVGVPAPGRLTPEAADQTVPAGVLHTPPHILISSLATALQEPARRLELVLNADADPLTVSQTDIAEVLANPGRFTDADVAAFETIRREFALRGTSDLFARVLVPTPEVEIENLATLGPLGVQISFTTSYSETRTGFTNSGTCSLQLTALSERRVGQPLITLPSGARALFIHDSGAESIKPAGNVSADGGFYVLEVWNASGQRVFSTQATLPQLTISDLSLDLRQFTDYVFSSATGDLFKIPVSGSSVTNGGNTNHTVTFAFESTSRQGASGAGTAASTTATPVIAAAFVGRYPIVLNNGTATVDLYPQGVVSVSYLGQTARLMPGCSGVISSGKRAGGTVGGATFDYAYSSRTLIVRVGSSLIFNSVLDPATRTG